MSVPLSIRVSLLAPAGLLLVALIAAAVGTVLSGARVGAGYAFPVLMLACIVSAVSVVVASIELASRPAWRSRSSYGLLVLGAIPLLLALLLAVSSGFGLSRETGAEPSVPAS
jgi:hypothetical protein